jgi:DNA-binding NarL/FixJ family response regulator
MPRRTAIQHTDRFIRTGLAFVLDREPDIDVVGQASSRDELVALCADTRPDAVLLEVDTEAWDASRLAAVLRKRQRTLQFVGLHGWLDPERARRARQAGIRSTVSYHAGVEGIVAALLGSSLTTPVSTLPSPSAPARVALTPREVEILGLTASGLLTREIAVELGITLKSIENHKQRIFRKLDVQNQAHAVSIAIRHGLLAPSAIAKRA